MNITTRVDMAQFDRAVLRLVEDLGLSFPNAVKQSARLLNAELLRFTAPRSRAQGRAAVARDIANAMWLLDPKKIHNETLRQAVLDEDIDAVQKFLTFAGKQFRTYQVRAFDRLLHQSKRDRRGRVQRSQRIIVLERPEYNRYVREIQGHVGALKFGWAISGRRLGVAIPAWVMGHSERQGDYDENLNPKTPTIAMTNRAPGVQNIDRGFVQRMVDRRTRAMTRDVERILAGGANKYF